MKCLLPNDIAGLFSLPVGIGLADPSIPSELWPQEWEFIKNAVPRRRLEFAAGRNAAREALSSLGCYPQPIGVNQDRSARWPEGFIGSITHCEGFCAAVVSNNEKLAGIGIDAESAESIAPALVHMICDASELDSFMPLPSLGFDWPKLAFSAKESFYKCSSGFSNFVLDFLDVTASFSVESDMQGTFEIRLKKALPRLRETCFPGRWLYKEHLLLTGSQAVWL